MKRVGITQAQYLYIIYKLDLEKLRQLMFSLTEEMKNSKNKQNSSLSSLKKLINSS